MTFTAPVPNSGLPFICNNRYFPVHNREDYTSAMTFLYRSSPGSQQLRYHPALSQDVWQLAHSLLRRRRVINVSKRSVSSCSTPRSDKRRAPGTQSQWAPVYKPSHRDLRRPGGQPGKPSSIEPFPVPITGRRAVRLLPDFPAYLCFHSHTRSMNLPVLSHAWSNLSTRAASTLTCVAIPAWSVPGIHTVLCPSILCHLTKIS